MLENLLDNRLTLVAGKWCDHRKVNVLVNCHEPPVATSTRVNHVTQDHEQRLILGSDMACGCRSDSPFHMLNIANISLPFVPCECLLPQPSTWDAQDSREDVQRPS